MLGCTNLLFTDKTSADIIADLQKILEAKAATGISDGEQASALRTQRLSRMQSSAASKKVPADTLPLKVEAVVGQLREDLQQDITLRKKAEAAAQTAELALAATRVELLTLQQSGEQTG